MTDHLDLDAWEWAYEEPDGDSDKQWLIDPGGVEWLFKPLKAERSQDEAASELAASRIAKLLGLPSARVELGTLGQETGCVSRNIIRDRTHSLVHGAIYIGAVVDNFDPKDRRSAGHSVENILTVVQGLGAPRDAGSDSSATAVFASYLIFDALIGNTDRHSKNWGVESSLTGPDLLAPTFDHATSLGITTRGERRERILSSEDRLQDFARKASAQRFENGRSTSLVDFAVRFLLRHAPGEQEVWTTVLTSMDLEQLNEIVGSSSMSPSGATLARNVLRINRERIIQCLTSS